MKFSRIRSVLSWEATAILAVMAAVVVALVSTGQQVWRTRQAAPEIARAFQEEPERTLSEMVNGGSPSFEAEIQCVACTNGPATNETPRI